VLAEYAVSRDERLLVPADGNEDAVVVRFPPGMALVQTVDILTPIVNDPYRFGQIAAANALSDVYAMGGRPYAAMNIVCFPAEKMPREVLRAILEGGRDKVLESGAVMAGGHSIKDDELKYGLSVSGVIDPARIATNRGLRPGDQLLLTKPVGTGVLSTALKAGLDNDGRLEALLVLWCSRLNANAAQVIETLRLQAATDVTGFGLGGHLLEMARASGTGIELQAARLPFLERALELAGMGMVPGGSHANRRHCRADVEVQPGVDPVITDLVFDAQTSGGLVLAVPREKYAPARDMLLSGGDLAAHIGEVTTRRTGRPRLLLRP
jgi:selenide, water dikinase